MADEAFWTDPAGKCHRVRIVERAVSTATIEYFDNSRRFDRWRNGRRYTHATRARVKVWLTELRAA